MWVSLSHGLRSWTEGKGGSELSPAFTSLHPDCGGPVSQCFKFPPACSTMMDCTLT